MVVRYRRRRGDLWALLAGFFVLAICMVIVRDGTVSDVEASLFHAINGLPDLLHWPMWVGQTLGLIGITLPLALGAAWWRRYRLAAALAATPLLKLLFEWWVVKALVERQRPGTSLTGAILRDAPESGLSFPSGHAIIAFAIAGLLAAYVDRPWGVGLYLLALLNGIARIYLGAHNPLDIVAGAALGIAIAALLNLITGVPDSTSPATVAGEPASSPPMAATPGGTPDGLAP